MMCCFVFEFVIDYICVNVVLLGIVEMLIFEIMMFVEQIEDYLGCFQEFILFGCVGWLDDVGCVVVWFCDFVNDWFIGVFVLIDGGLGFGLGC